MIDFDLYSIPAAELKTLIEKYNEAYRIGIPTISDAEYDTLVEQLYQLDPNSEWFSHTEPVIVSSDRKLKLPIPMKSLNKVHNISEFKKWAKSLALTDTTDVVIMPKFDGVSLLVNQQNGISYSRGGSDNEGQDCSEHFAKSKNASLTTKFKYTFGEFIFSQQNWKENFTNRVSPNTGKPYKSSRNTIAGLINSDTASELLNFAELYRYGISEQDIDNTDFSLFSEILNALNSDFHQIPMYEICKIKDIDEDFLFGYFDKWNKLYQIDGIVVYINDLHLWESIGRHQTTGNPLYAIAFKSPNFSQLFETSVRGVNWKVSKSGALKPTVEIEMVDTGDCEMKNPTGYNAGWINDMNIATGAKILVIRSGGVIPKIVKVIEEPKQNTIEDMWDDLAECPHCGSPTAWNESGKELCCTNPNCNGIKIAKIIHFFTTVGCDEIGEETFNKIFNNGFTSIKAMLDITSKDLLCIEGFGESIATTILKNNERIKNGIELPILMHASDCFENIGLIKANQLLDKMNEKQLSDLYELNFIPLKEQDTEKESKTIQSFHKGILPFYQFIKNNGLIIASPVQKVIDANGKCAGMYVCFSGIRDSELENKIISNGGKIASSVSKNTTHLVVKDINSTSSKLEKAKTLNISIFSIEEFTEMLNS